MDPAIALAGATVGLTCICLFYCKKPLLAVFQRFWPSPPAEEPVARRLAEYAQELDIQNVPLLTPEQYLGEIATHLEFKCLEHGIQTLPGGHSWGELAHSDWSSPSPIIFILYVLQNAS